MAPCTSRKERLFDHGGDAAALGVHVACKHCERSDEQKHQESFSVRNRTRQIVCGRCCKRGRVVAICEEQVVVLCCSLVAHDIVVLVYAHVVHSPAIMVRRLVVACVLVRVAARAAMDVPRSTLEERNKGQASSKRLRTSGPILENYIARVRIGMLVGPSERCLGNSKCCCWGSPMGAIQ